MDAQSIFLSYSQKNADIADILDKVCQSYGMQVLRDIREVKYNQSFKEYMKGIRKTDYVLVLISDNFLKSQACMYEIHEVMKDENYQERILPILLPLTHIFKPKDQIIYLKYWDDQYKELLKQIEEFEPCDTLEYISDLKEIKNIKSTINAFLKHLSNINVLTFETLQLEKFKPVLSYLGISDELQTLYFN